MNRHRASLAANSRWLCVLGVVIAALPLGLRTANAYPVVQTTTIVQDDFSITNSTANAANPVDATTNVSGRSPDLADLPGATYTTWSLASGGGDATQAIDTSAGNPFPSATTGFNSATYLNIGSNASAGYTSADNDHA